MMRLVAVCIGVLNVVFGSDDCECRNLYDFEHAPYDQTGARRCVGGIGGNRFQFHSADGTMVKTMRLWWGDFPITGVSITYFGETSSHMTGATDRNSKEITFKPGEHIRGTVTLGDYGGSLAYVYFETSADNKFEAGHKGDNTKVYFNSGNSFLSGVFGKSRDGYYLYQFGFLFWKPIKSLTLTDIKYPTLDNQPKIRNPSVIGRREYCNEFDVPMPAAQYERMTEQTTGFDSCFENSYTRTFGASLKVTGTIPVISVGVEAEAHWEASSSQTIKNCEQKSETTKEKITFPAVNIPARTRMFYEFMQWSGHLDQLDYNATLDVEFESGTHWRRELQGSYNGSSYTHIKQQWTDKTTGVQDCSQADAVSLV